MKFWNTGGKCYLCHCRFYCSTSSGGSHESQLLRRSVVRERCRWFIIRCSRSIHGVVVGWWCHGSGSRRRWRWRGIRCISSVWCRICASELGLVVVRVEPWVVWWNVGSSRPSVGRLRDLSCSSPWEATGCYHTDARLAVRRSRSDCVVSLACGCANTDDDDDWYHTRHKNADDNYGDDVSRNWRRIIATCIIEVAFVFITGAVEDFT